jgi:spermidine synthase
VRNIWFTEKTDDIALSLRHGGSLYRGQSPVQRVEVLNTYRYGKMLVLDGTVAFTERDECVYHEMLVHPAGMSHPGVRTALVVGGGDGGACRELLRYPSIESVTVVEIDATVVDACREHFPHMAAALDDPRVDLEIADGLAFAEDASPESYDLVVVDAGGPDTDASGLFGEAFYRNVNRCLTADGVLAAQTQRPTLDSKAFVTTYRNQRHAFEQGTVRCYLAFIPSFTTGMLSFSLATKAVAHPLIDFQPERAQAFASRNGLKYYNEDVHGAAFALPTFVKDLLAEAA